MLRVQERQKQVAARKKADYEGYHNFEYENLLLDELTDQTERLAMPMANPGLYQRDGEGRLFVWNNEGEPDYLEKILDKGIQDAAYEAQNDPLNWSFEYERRLIEREELEATQALQEGEKMMVVSIIPDAVREGQTKISGYDRKRMKSLVRLFEARDGEMHSISFSLDQSNYEGLQYAAAVVGKEIPDGLTSEQMLAQRHYFDDSSELSLDDIHNFVRSGYDTYLGREHGGSWYAGRKVEEISEEKMDAMTFIKSQPDLISEHMQAIQDVMAQALNKTQQKKLLEKARYNFAAGLHKRMLGEDFDDRNDAGDIAAADGLVFDGDCATGSGGSGSGGAAEQAGKLGYNRGKIKNGEMPCVTCPHCRKVVDAKVINEVIYCANKKCDKFFGEETNNDDNEEDTPKTIQDMILRFEEEKKQKQKLNEEQSKTDLNKKLGSLSTQKTDS